MAWIEAKALSGERLRQIEAKGNQLGLDALGAWQRAQRLQRVVQQFFREPQLRPAGGDVQPAEQRLVFLDDVEGVARDLAVLHGDTAGKGPGIDEFLDEIERAAVIPVQLLTPL